MQPDVRTVREFLARVGRRLTWLSIAQGAAIGLAVALIGAFAGWPARANAISVLLAGVAAAAVGAAISVLLTAGQRRRAALLIERRTPHSRNLIVTAAELAARPIDGYVPGLVFREAARLVGSLDPSALFPARRALVALALILAAWLLVVARPSLPIPMAMRGVGPGSAPNGPRIEAIDVIIRPPAYVGLPVQTVRDPSRIEVLAGSRVSLAVRARAERVLVETLASRDTVAARGSAFEATIAADADGYVAVEPVTNGQAGPRRLIGVSVQPDALPRVRIVAPGHDQRLPDGRRRLEIGIESSDDIGLATLVLRFTRVSGSGERFTFVDGQVPLSITRRDARSWTARAVWSLESLELGPGDMVVYKAVASDARGAAGTSESDSYIAEIMAPGGIAAPGFAVDPEQERYAVSQQMVIVKTERLIARRASLSGEALAEESQQIAAEQRKVRAEFVFMLGGELADAADVAESMTEINEEEEAERESDILAGRNANAGHVALLRAIRAMSRAAAALTASEPTAALTHERTALTHLERAFSHSRILLRALTTRERLDLARRLTGSLTDAAGDVRPTADAEASSTAQELRRSLADVAGLASSGDVGPSAASRSSWLAERVLRVDPSMRTVQEASSQLSAAAAALAAGDRANARAALERASATILAVLRRELLDAPRRASTIDEARRDGAFVDALRSVRPR